MKVVEGSRVHTIRLQQRYSRNEDVSSAMPLVDALLQSLALLYEPSLAEIVGVRLKTGECSIDLSPECLQGR